MEKKILDFEQVTHGDSEATVDGKKYNVIDLKCQRLDVRTDTTGAYSPMLSYWEGILSEQDAPARFSRLTLLWREPKWGGPYWEFEPEIVIFRGEFVTPEERDEILDEEREEQEKEQK